MKCLHICTLAILLLASRATFAQAKKSAEPQRTIIIMMDGFGDDYYHDSNMPTLNAMAKQGLYKVVKGLMPSVTNLNNAAIITGQYPDVNGITGNSFVNPASGQEEYTEDPNLLLAPTIFERAKKQGVHSILFTVKTKTAQLLSTGTDEVVCHDKPGDAWIKLFGNPPDVYSREVNYWMMDAALYALKNKKEYGLVYIHTTDYPMHTWAPESAESKEHLHHIDEYLKKLHEAAPDAAILITADHNVHHKTVAWDIEKACQARGTAVKMSLNPEKDKYVKHHLGLGGTEYVYLNSPGDLEQVRKTILSLKGVEEVITRQEAAKRYHLKADRIGDLIVLGDRNTVFGKLEEAESRSLPDNYRTHGSIYEAEVPLFIYNARNMPAASYFTHNFKLAAWLY